MWVAGAPQAQGSEGAETSRRVKTPKLIVKGKMEKSSTLNRINDVLATWAGEEHVMMTTITSSGELRQ